jgi:hypothetical protein
VKLLFDFLYIFQNIFTVAGAYAAMCQTKFTLNMILVHQSPSPAPSKKFLVLKVVLHFD